MKIQVLMRHCFYSAISQHKKRFSWFSHENCFENFLKMTDFRKVDLTLFLDTHYAGSVPHFIEVQDQFPVIKIDAGSETKSFLALLEFAKSQAYDDETIVYFLEDDYLHRPNWVEVMQEGFSIPGVDYLTLFDHKDKYFFKEYEDLHSKLYVTDSCHFRTTPSTTNTYAMRSKTLIFDYELHRQFSLEKTISEDHEKFLALGQKGRTLLSPIPGYSTHVEKEFASPCTDWKNLGEGKKRELFSFFRKKSYT